MGFSYCRDLSTKRKSLLHIEGDISAFMFMSQSKQLSTDSDARVKLTNILESGHGPNSVLLDITDRNETTESILQLIAQQYPARTAVLIRHEKVATFAEINFDGADASFSAILKRGIKFHDQSVTIPCVALDHGSTVVNVHLYNLPLLSKKKLTDRLKSSLGQFGNILDVGIFLEPKTNTFMGDGYAIIATKAGSLKKLTHIIKDDYDGYDFYAVWKGMPDFCYCCHADDHVVENCPKREIGMTSTVIKNRINEKEQDGFKEYALFLVKDSKMYIHIKVADDNGVQIYRLKRNCRLSKVMDTYRQRGGHGSSGIRFSYNERPVLDDDTPNSLSMNKFDVITVMME